MGDWNFCAEADLPITHEFFPDIPVSGKDLVQIAASGPDSERSSIMLSYLAAINQAQRSVYITTPYFIPNEAIYNALQQAALSGIDVRLLVPGLSDSRLVNLAASSFYEDLLACGVKIYRYNKGFVHAKTMVVDDNLSVVGTANMDIRSFDFNFEVNAFVYSREMNWKLSEAFLQDCLYAGQLELGDWRARGGGRAYARRWYGCSARCYKGIKKYSSKDFDISKMYLYLHHGRSDDREGGKCSGG